jgi:hypothetical protein
MSDDVRQELVDVIAEALLAEGWSQFTSDHQARAVLAALVERYGEPEIEDNFHTRHYWTVCGDASDPMFGQVVSEPRPPQRRLVFPWQPVEGGRG